MPCMTAWFPHSEDGRIMAICSEISDLEKKSAQNLFIQLLDDAFLHSELSSNDYLSPGKDILRSEEVPDAQ